MKPPKSSNRSKTKPNPNPKSISISESKSKQSVNWLDLPQDVAIKIFTKLGTVEVLLNAQRVCSTWRNLAREPQLYRVVDLYNPWRYFDVTDDNMPLESMATLAIGRSCGQLVEFSIDGWCTEDILYKLMQETPSMKCLRLANCDGFEEWCLIQVIQNLPLLEEVEFILPWFSKQVLEAVGRSCPKLKSFRLNGPGGELSSGDDTDEDEEDAEWFNGEAITIAENMNPGLRSLHLLGNSMNNNGLEALLQRFTQLEYLDLRRCDNLRLTGDLLRRCQQVKTLRLPKDSLEDYQYQVGELNEGGGNRLETILDGDGDGIGESGCAYNLGFLGNQQCDGKFNYADFGFEVHIIGNPSCTVANRCNLVLSLSA